MSPVTKRNSRKAKSFLDQEKYTAELTSIQLVSGVCILLIFGLFCFLGGILVGKFEGGPRIDSVGRSPIQTTLPDSTPVVSRQVDQHPTGQSDPPPKSSQPTRPTTPSLAKAPRAPEGRQTSPRTVELPAPPPKRTPLARGEESQPAPVRTHSAASKPPDSTPTTPKTSSSSLAQRQKQGAGVVAQSVSKGPYTVQIGAYGNRRLADKMKKTVETGSAYSVELFDPGSGKYVIVYVGRFADRASAEDARDEIRKVFGVADCFVKKRT